MEDNEFELWASKWMSMQSRLTLAEEVEPERPASPLSEREAPSPGAEPKSLHRSADEGNIDAVAEELADSRSTSPSAPASRKSSVSSESPPEPLAPGQWKRRIPSQPRQADRNRSLSKKPGNPQESPEIPSLAPENSPPQSRSILAADLAAYGVIAAPPVVHSPSDTFVRRSSDSSAKESNVIKFRGFRLHTLGTHPYPRDLCLS